MYKKWDWDKIRCRIVRDKMRLRGDKEAKHQVQGMEKCARNSRWKKNTKSYTAILY